MLATPLIAPMAGCNVFKPLPAGAKAFLQMNTDPNDPMIGQLFNPNTNETIIFYGTKDANGLVTKIDLMQYYAAGSSEPYTIQYDENTNPVFITGPQGQVATLTYDGDNVSVTFKDVDGKVSVETFPLDPNAKIKREAALQKARAGLDAISAKASAAKETTVKVIRGFVRVDLYVDNFKAGTLKDAKLSVTATNLDGIIPVGYNSASGYYEFSVPHRVENLQVLIDECAAVTGHSSAFFTYAGVALAALAAICIGVTGGFCGFILGPGGAIIGMGVAGAGGTATAANYACDDLILNAAVSSGQGQQKVTVNVSHPTLNIVGSGDQSYDLFNTSDPVTSAGSFTMILAAQTEASILNVRTSPPAPSAGQSYSVTFDFIPPSADIRYTITGTDGFSKTETLTGDGTTGTVTGTSIPGGAANVTDSITADILVGGSAVGSATPISITFR